MENHDELAPIDEFEAKVGNREAIRRTCDFMAAYLAKADEPLPEIAAQGLSAVLKYRDGETTIQELDATGQALWAYLREKSVIVDYETPVHCIVHAVLAILESYRKPEWGGGASELASNFLYATNRFGIGTVQLKPLLAEYFPS